MEYGAVIETKQNGRLIKEASPWFDDKLSAEAWLHARCREARSMKMRITDHFLTSIREEGGA